MSAIVWQGIAQYLAGFDPRTQQHPAEDAPPISITTIDNAMQMLFGQDNIDDVTKGFLAAEKDYREGRPGGFRRWPVEQRAAFLVATGRPAEEDDGEGVQHWYATVQGIWERWLAMVGGDNPALVRAKAGPRRDFDINLDGMAHYGLLPDMLQDIRNQGLAVDDFAPLFRSAGDYVEVWAKCQRRSEALVAATALAAAIPAAADAGDVEVIPAA